MLLGDGVDPARVANSGPVVEWANAWKEAARDPALADRLTVAWKRWSIRLSQSQRPWTLVRGPAGAFLATASRLGWQSQAPFSLTFGSVRADLRLVDAWWLHAQVVQECEAQLQREWTDAGETRLESLKYVSSPCGPC